MAKFDLGGAVSTHNLLLASSVAAAANNNLNSVEQQLYKSQPNLVLASSAVLPDAATANAQPHQVCTTY